jgi:hypothetical protein
MIVSHKHRFIFVKTRKTAGTSIEVALSQIAGDDAIVTPIDPPEPRHDPRNYRSDRAAWSELLRWALANPRGRTRPLLGFVRGAQGERRYDYYNHMPAWLIRAKVGHNTWDTYFKFCFERNPWDKVLSLYSWLARDSPNAPPFEEWLLTDPNLLSDWSLYSLDRRCAVDAVGQYERLDTDLRSFLERVGVPTDGLVLPRAKAGIPRSGYLYSPRAVERVRRVFCHEVEMFGYDCPSDLRMEP